MKKVVMATVAITLLASMQTAVARAPKTDPIVQFVSSPSLDYPSTIDGIDVPYEVVTYVQLKYQGYAVTQARKVMHNGKSVYRLRVDQDSIPNDYESFYLMYSIDWKLLGEQQITAPPKPVVKEEPKDEQPEETKPAQEDKPDEKPARGGEGPSENQDEEEGDNQKPDEAKPDDSQNRKPDGSEDS